MKLGGNIFLTGGTGTLGTALMLRAQRENWPCRFTVYSRDPLRQARLRQLFGRDHRYVLGDVRSLDDLMLAVAGHETVIHAAALKHIPQCETQPQEAISVNITGSHNVAMACLANGVERCVNISTDKACKPLNLYGMTKAVNERVWQQLNRYGVTRFNLCRYGNVVSSHGSVIPVWRQLAAEGKDLGITDKRMTRFWLTVDMAVDLLLRTLREEQPGTILIPRAHAMKLLDVLHVVGGPGVRWAEIGMRPGEKIHEDLLSVEEAPWAESLAEMYRLHPMTTPPLRERIDPLNFLRSDGPDAWVAPEEMAAWISEAEERERYVGI